MPTKPRFKLCMLAVTLAAMPLLVEAAGLGRLNVLSGLGQPFRGEIELVALQGNEVETLKVGLAGVDVYSAAQLSYPSPSLGLRLVLNKRANGQYVVQVSSVGSIDDPVFNLLVDLSWLGGRIQREYTALIDPAGYGGATITPVAPPSDMRVTPESQSSPRSAVPSAITPPIAQTRPARLGTTPIASAPAMKIRQDYTVKAGDTLSSIAGKVKPEGVSLDQVLVGLYQSNQDAFDGNMNRLKRGKILHVPAASELAAVDQSDAVKEIKAHAANWQNYRRQLAESTAKAPSADVAGQQTSGGRITAKVEDKGALVAEKNKDVLKLSRGANKVDDQKNRVRALEEEGAARKKALDEANQRVAELQKNIREMEKLAAMTSKSGAELQQKAEQIKASAAVPVAPSKLLVASVPEQIASKPAMVASAVPASLAATVSASDVKAKPKRVVPPLAPVVAPEAGVVDMLMENALPIGGGLVAALLGVMGLLWSRNRRRPSVFENSLITSGDLKPNTVLGRTGGGVISTQAENSFLTDFSRQGLGTIDTDEVDPIAEADVYMAYGRNVQAEEILKDALVKDPHRQEIRMKLLEIFVARKDKTAFEEVAADLYAATGGTGQHWEQALYLGCSIDPENPLYSRQGEAVVDPSISAGTVAVSVATVAAATMGLDALAESGQAPQSSAAVQEEENTLDFEFEMPGAEIESNPVLDEAEEIDLSFDLDTQKEDFPDLSEVEATEDDALMALDLPIDLGQAFSAMADSVDEPLGNEPLLDPASETMDFDVSALDMPDLNLDLDSMPSVEESDAEVQAIADFNAQLSAMDESESAEIVMSAAEGNIDLNFDFNMDAVRPEVESVVTPIDLDLEMSGGSAEHMDFTADDPVQTKIDLARAYIDMGDVEGAREILQEAEQEGSPLQQDQARSLLANL